MEYTYTSIDGAKDSLVVATKLAGKVTTSLYSNDRKGIKEFLKGLPSETWCVIEATGVYSLQLAIALYEKGIKVSVVNPLQIKRFAQAKLWEEQNRQGGSRAVTDWAFPRPRERSSRSFCCGSSISWMANCFRVFYRS